MATPRKMTPWPNDNENDNIDNDNNTHGLKGTRHTRSLSDRKMKKLTKSPKKNSRLCCSAPAILEPEIPRHFVASTTTLNHGIGTNVDNGNCSTISYLIPGITGKARCLADRPKEVVPTTRRNKNKHDSSSSSPTLSSGQSVVSLSDGSVRNWYTPTTTTTTSKSEEQRILSPRSLGHRGWNEDDDDDYRRGGLRRLRLQTSLPQLRSTVASDDQSTLTPLTMPGNSMPLQFQEDTKIHHNEILGKTKFQPGDDSTNTMSLDKMILYNFHKSMPELSRDEKLFGVEGKDEQLHDLRHRRSSWDETLETTKWPSSDTHGRILHDTRTNSLRKQLGSIRLLLAEHQRNHRNHRDFLAPPLVTSNESP